MLNSLEAAVSTLEEAGALTYDITQPGSFKIRGEATDTQGLIDKFLGDWDKLVPGIYKVDYSKSATDKRTGLCFRVSKTQAAAGSPAQLAGFDNDRIAGLQQQITNLETERRIEAIQAQHREELRALQAKFENKSGGLGALDGPTILAGLDRVQGLINSMNGNRPQIAQVSGPPITPDLGAGEAALATALETLANVLGQDLLVITMQKLAAKAQQNPDKVRQSLGFIDML